MIHSTKKKVNRYFNGKITARLIVSVEADIVALVDEVITGNPTHPAARNRSEFVRLAILEKLGRGG
ncbi:toxin-antitoxin system protein [Serratia sp. T13T92]|uniref:toxin-antitoxin system protein n=1 Tax=Serratia sp. T13T92 TaxID=3397496 RepID=UPI0039E1C94E